MQDPAQHAGSEPVRSGPRRRRRVGRASPRWQMPAGVRSRPCLLFGQTTAHPRRTALPHAETRRREELNAGWSPRPPRLRVRNSMQWNGICIGMETGGVRLNGRGSWGRVGTGAVLGGGRFGERGRWVAKAPGGASLRGLSLGDRDRASALGRRCRTRLFQGAPSCHGASCAR